MAESHSILNDVKKAVGIASDFDVFDLDIIMHINSVFATLNQLAVGPRETFFIEDESSKWEDFLQDKAAINSVKSYMVLKVRLLFDPPTSASVLASYEKMALEYEWRLNVVADPWPHQNSEGDISNV